MIRILIFLLLTLGFCPVSYANQTFIIKKKPYKLKVIIEKNLYKKEICRKVLSNALEFFPVKWQAEVKTFRFTDKKRIFDYRVAEDTSALYLRNLKEIVFFSSLKNITPNEFIKTVIHEYSHGVDINSGKWPSKLRKRMLSIMTDSYGADAEFFLWSRQRLNHEMSELWARLAENCLINPIRAKKRYKQWFNFLSQVVSVTAPKYNIIKSWKIHNKKIESEFKKKILKNCIHGLIIEVNNSHIKILNKKIGKTVSLPLVKYTYKFQNALSGYAKNISNFSFVAKQCVLFFTKPSPQVGDRVFVLNNKIILFLPLSLQRQREHNKNCELCKIAPR